MQIILNPARVERVIFTSTSDLEEDFELAAWTEIRLLVDEIDRRLRALAAESVGGS